MATLLPGKDQRKVRLARLAGLKSLVKLNLADTGVTIQGLKQLAGRNFTVLKLPAGSYIDD